MSEYSSFELAVGESVCESVGGVSVVDHVETLMLLVKLMYASEANVNIPRLKCYAREGSHQLDVRMKGEVDDKKPENFPAIVVEVDSSNYNKIALGNNLGINETKDREALGYSATNSVIFRHIVKNKSDATRLAELTAGLLLTLGAQLLMRHTAIGKFELTSISTTNEKIPLPDQYFAVDLVISFEYIYAVTRLCESHRIRGVFTNTTY